jgi:carboxypeptidase Taq
VAALAAQTFFRIAGMTAYQQLQRRFLRLKAVNDASGVLSWDYQTMMPEGAADGRGEQMATLSVIAHELLTAAEVADLLAAAEQDAAALNLWEAADLREMRRLYLHAAALPADLVEATSKAASSCEMVWRGARADSDFPRLLPKLRDLLGLVRQGAEIKAEKLGLSPYDALLDEYDPGNRSARIDVVFAELAAFLPELIGRVIDAQAALAPAVPLSGPFPADKQKALGESLMRQAGFDFTRGRLDVSLHPFCGGATDDVRITTRYDEGDFMRALLGVLHETGHALYEQGLPAERRRLPVGSARGMTAHESQSLIIEMQATRTDEFLSRLAPLAAEAFGGAGPAWSVDNFKRHCRKVERSFIRVDADEVTYPAHVVLRYRLERALIAGDLDLADLPGAWNDGMVELLGITPPDDRRGCLQDIHWPGGAFGYFPTYTLGAMTAAQLFAAATAENPAIRPGLAQGDFAPLVGWLRTKVHGRGCLPESAEALLVEATGKPLDPQIFRRHLEDRYLSAA